MPFKYDPELDKTYDPDTGWEFHISYRAYNEQGYALSHPEHGVIRYEGEYETVEKIAESDPSSGRPPYFRKKFHLDSVNGRKASAASIEHIEMLHAALEAGGRSGKRYNGPVEMVLRY